MSNAHCVGAFFDIDGTLIEGPSLEWRFVAYLLAHHEIPARNLAPWLARASRGAVQWPPRTILENKLHLSGLRASLAAEWEKSLNATATSPAAALRFFALALERIDWHLAQGHRVFLLSGTIEPLAWVAQRRIQRDIGVCATRLETARGCWTGALLGEHMSGEAKAKALRDLADRHSLALARSYAYGNAASDEAMLDMVGHPHAVNPSWRLAASALRRRWEICRWRGGEARRMLQTQIAAREAR
jgi:HAD superfamily hydrolase (TIGR01490 family)